MTANEQPKLDLEALNPKSWEVEIRIEGESVLTIGHSHLSGIENIDQYGDTVRTCAEHLMAFIGNGDPTPCFGCGGSGQERWMGANGEEVGPCSVCSDPAFPLESDTADGASLRHEGGLREGLSKVGIANFLRDWAYERFGKRIFHTTAHEAAETILTLTAGASNAEDRGVQ